MAVSYLQQRRSPRGQIKADALGPGSVERSVAAKLGEILSAEDVGLAPGATADAKAYLDDLWIASLSDGKQEMRINSGIYRLYTTWKPQDRAEGGTSLLAKPVRGATIRGGEGYVGYAVNALASYQITAPILVWHGTVGGTMVELDSLLGIVFEGIHFVGGTDTDGSSANRAGIGINISQRGALIGSGTHLFRRCSWNDFSTAVRCGEGQLTGAGNCDTTVFDNCKIQSVDRFLHLTHQQNLCYHFSGMTDVNTVKRIVHSEAGGFVNFDFLNARDIGGSGSDDWAFDLVGGSTSGVHRIGPTRLEESSGVGSKQLMRLNGSYVPVIWDGLFEAQGNQSVTMFELTGGQLTLRGGKLITHNTSAPTFSLKQHTSSGTGPTLILQGVEFDATQFTYAEWITHATNTFPNVILRDCFLQGGRVIPSFSTRIENRLPVPLTGSTTNDSTTVGLTLLGNAQTGRFDNCCTIQRGLHRIRMVLVCGVQSAGVITSKQLMAVREFDLFKDASTLAISDTQTVGTDYNPDSLSFTLVSDTARAYIRVDVVGKASTNLYWRAEFTLLGTYPMFTL